MQLNYSIKGAQRFCHIYFTKSLIHCFIKLLVKYIKHSDTHKLENKNKLFSSSIVFQTCVINPDMYKRT